MILVSFLIQPILYLTTKSTSTITVTKKFIFPSSRSSIYKIVDENNIIYNLTNLSFLGNYNAFNNYDKIVIGKKYKIDYYFSKNIYNIHAIN